MFNKFFLRKLHSDDVPIKCYVAKVITLQRILFFFLAVSAASFGWIFMITVGQLLRAYGSKIYVQR